MKKTEKVKKSTKQIRTGKREKTFGFADVSERQKDFLVFALLLLLLIVFFHDFVFESKTVKAPDTIASVPFSKWGKENIFQDHTLPQWIPHLFSGMPSYGSFVFTPSYPVGLLFRLFLVKISPFLGDVMTLFIIHLLFAGISLFYFMRSKNLDRFSSFIAAITFMFTCHFIGLINGGHTIKMWTICYIPMMFLLIDKVVARPSVQGTLLAGVIFGLMLMARHVQIVYYFLLSAGLFVLFMTGWELREKREIKSALLKLCSFGSVVIIGFLLASFLYIPIYEYSAYSIRGSGGVSYDYATSWSFRPLEMMTFLIPSFYGFGGQTYWGGMPFTDSPMYMGLIPLILSVIALVYRRNKYTIFFGILGLLFLIFSFGKYFPLVYSVLYNVLPFFNKFRAPVMMQLMLEFSVAILAGYGVHVLLAKYKEARSNQTFEKLQKIVIRISIGLVILFVIVLLARDRVFSILSSMGMFVKGQEVSAYDQQTLARLKALRFDLLASDFYKMVGLFVTATFILVLFLRKKISAQLFTLVLSFVLIADLWLVDSRILRLEKGLNLDQIFVKNATVTYLQEDPDTFRIFPLGQLFGRNEWIYYDLQTIGGYHPAKLKIYNEMLENALYSQKQGFPINMRLVNLLNVKYLIAPGRINHPDLELVHFDKNYGYLTYRNKKVLPRAFFIDSVRVIKDKQAIFEILNSDSFDPQKVAILEKELPSAPGRNERAEVTITRYDIHEIELKAKNLENPGLLFLSEIYYPAGWHAYIDGQEVEIYKTNYIFRSVLVPPGEHRIQFIFKPRSFKIGMWVSTTSALICIFGLIYTKKSKRKS